MRRSAGAQSRGTDQRAPQLDRVEQRGAGAAATQLEDPQLVGAVGEVERDAEVADQVDAELRQRAPPAEIGDAPGPGREVREVAPRAGAVQVALLRLELVRLDERFRRAPTPGRCARGGRRR